ncbi:hypothetical protein [Nocardia sp. NPDC058114]
MPDLDDRHVLAVSIKIGAQVIVTANLREFPAHILADCDDLLVVGGDGS